MAALRRSCPRRAWSWSRPPPPRRSPRRTSRPRPRCPLLRQTLTRGADTRARPTEKTGKGN